jgi:hypothetical protein
MTAMKWPQKSLPYLSLQLYVIEYKSLCQKDLLKMIKGASARI